MIKPIVNFVNVTLCIISLLSHRTPWLVNIVNAIFNEDTTEKLMIFHQCDMLLIFS